MGLDPEKDVKLTQMPRPDWANVIAQLERGDVQFSVLPPPYDRMGEKKGFHTLFSLPDLGIHWQQNGEWVLRSYVASNREAVLRFVRALADAMQVYFNQKEKTITYLTEFLGSNREDTEYAYQIFAKWADRNPRPKADSIKNTLLAISGTTPKATTADPDFVHRYQHRRPVTQGRIFQIARASVDNVLDGGEGGIRTPGTLIRGTHDFQSCTFNRSVTSPFRNLKYLRAPPCCSIPQMSPKRLHGASQLTVLQLIRTGGQGQR